MLRSLSVLLPFAVAEEPNVMYYRYGNHDKTTKLDTVSSDADVQLREWDTGFKIFDSPLDMKVQRLDITGSGRATLYQDQLLSLPDGPIYIFANASAVHFEDHTGQTSSMQYTDSIAWVSQGSCVKLSVELGNEEGVADAASLLIVSSGAPSMTGSQDTNSCEAATILIGTPALSRNEVSYRISPAGSCKSGLNHGSDGYSNLDMPIGPLQAHYHTRGAMYYVQHGWAGYNDEGVEDDFLLGGELRYVAPGVWYGPETMARNTYVASIHEPDPSAIVTNGHPIPNNCAFACTSHDADPGLCVKEDVLAEITQV